MEFEESKVRYVDEQINKHRDLLLANFGAQGIRRSKFKAEIVMNIIGSVPGKKSDNVDLFFWRLGMAYEQDAQFKHFTKAEITKILNGEHVYILAKVLMEEEK